MALGILVFSISTVGTLELKKTKMSEGVVLYRYVTANQVIPVGYENRGIYFDGIVRSGAPFLTSDGLGNYTCSTPGLYRVDLHVQVVGNDTGGPLVLQVWSNGDYVAESRTEFTPGNVTTIELTAVVELLAEGTLGVVINNYGAQPVTIEGVRGAAYKGAYMIVTKI